MSVEKTRKCPTCAGFGKCADGSTCPDCEGTGEMISGEVPLEEPCWPA